MKICIQLTYLSDDKVELIGPFPGGRQADQFYEDWNLRHLRRAKLLALEFRYYRTVLAQDEKAEFIVPEYWVHPDNRKV